MSKQKNTRHFWHLQIAQFLLLPMVIDLEILVLHGKGLMHFLPLINSISLAGSITGAMAKVFTQTFFTFTKSCCAMFFTPWNQRVLQSKSFMLFILGGMPSNQQAKLESSLARASIESSLARASIGHNTLLLTLTKSSCYHLKPVRSSAREDVINYHTKVLHANLFKLSSTCETHFTRTNFLELKRQVSWFI